VTSTRSSYNGNGASVGNGPAPKYLQSPAVVDAKAITVTFWDLL
jgi:hypothetical protein